MMFGTGKFPLGASLLALAFALSGCGKQTAQDNQQVAVAAESSSAALPPLPAVMPLVAGPAAPVRKAPAAAALPKARALDYASAAGNDRYAWIDRADRISDAIGDAPPDYAFDYADGEQPYGWETAGGYRTFAEPTDDGYRYYYYDPGADEPYLVRDSDYSYGYADGRIVSIYDRGGRALSDYELRRRGDWASRYYERARELRRAAEARHRRGVVAAQWADRRSAFSGQRDQWDRARYAEPEWRAYRNDHRGDDARLAAEREARAQAARQFSAWQGQGFRGDAPVLYQPRPADPRRNGGLTPQQVAENRRDTARQQQILQQQQAQQQREQMQQQRVQEQQRAQAERQRQAQQAQAQALQQRQQAAAVQQRSAEQAQQARLAQQKQEMAQKQQAQQHAAAQAQQARALQQKQAQEKAQAQQRAAQVQAQQARLAQQKQAQEQAQQARLAQQKQAQEQAQQARLAQQKQALLAKQQAQQAAAQKQAAELRQRQAEQAKRAAEAVQARQAAQAKQVAQAAEQRAARQAAQAQAVAQRKAAMEQRQGAKPSAP